MIKIKFHPLGIYRKIPESSYNLNSTEFKKYNGRKVLINDFHGQGVYGIFFYKDSFNYDLAIPDKKDKIELRPDDIEELLVKISLRNFLRK